MFHKFEQKLNDLSQGTVGYFCMRCHAPVATALCASRAEPLWNLPEVAREGITCIACHRVQYVYGKSNGERRIEPGDIFAPVFGGIGGDGVAEAIARKDQFKVKTSPDEQAPARTSTSTGIYFQPLTRSEFCTPCHQVAVHPGIKLEVVWEQYRASPACKKGIQCQDCHMGRVPGLPLGYDCGPVAKVADKTVNDNRKKSNHIFFGPNYPIAHPGVFPFHLKANRWTMDQWLTFDWRAGWGTKEFEDRVADGADSGRASRPCGPRPTTASMPARSSTRTSRSSSTSATSASQVMENGSHVEGPFFDSHAAAAARTSTSTTSSRTRTKATTCSPPRSAPSRSCGPTSCSIGPDGQRLWETGYTDSLRRRGQHPLRTMSATRRLPYDWQLFNLQTMFLITGAKGTDREFYVPVNVDIDQLPFIRPGAQPISRHQPSAVHPHGKPVARAARLAPSAVSHSRRAAPAAGHVSPVVPHAQPGRTHLLHAVLRRDGGNGALDERMDDRRPPDDRGVRSCASDAIRPSIHDDAANAKFDDPRSRHRHRGCAALAVLSRLQSGHDVGARNTVPRPSRPSRSLVDSTIRPSRVVATIRPNLLATPAGAVSPPTAVRLGRPSTAAAIVLLPSLGRYGSSHRDAGRRFGSLAYADGRTGATVERPVMRSSPHDAMLNSMPPTNPLRRSARAARPYSSDDFSPDPFCEPCRTTRVPSKASTAASTSIPTQRPLIEWGMPLYDTGPVPPPSLDCGPTNPSLPRFYLYGDYRAAAAYNEQNGHDKGVLANRLNLEWDLWLTSTERFHMFTGPLQRDNDFKRVEFDDGDAEFFDELDFFDADTDTLFFEGDLGYMLGGWTGRYAPFDMPITVGLIPLVFQNGVWMEDAIVGAAVTIPARNSPLARLVELRRHVLRRLRPGHQPGVRRQQRGRQRLRRHHVDRSQAAATSKLGYAFLDDTADSAAATTTSASRTRGGISTSCPTRCA